MRKQAQALFKPIPSQPPELPGNPATPDKVALGRMLYFEPRLSSSHAISCNTCHMIGMGGVDLQETSLGHRWQRGDRNAPTVYNAVFDTAQFWDGRASDLEQQAGGPLVNPVEMDATEAHVVEQLKEVPGYAPLFARAFPGGGEAISFENVRRAIAAFEATLITPGAPFDRYLQGADILPPGDKGRFEVTRTVSDEYVFRVPGLRNVALTAPYFHSGKVWDLRQAVAIMGSSQLGAQLTDAEVDDITAFLGSLTAPQPEVTLPALPPSVAATPRPQP